MTDQASPVSPAGVASNSAEEVLFEGRPAVLQNILELLVGVLTLGIGVIFFWVRSLGRHYRITTQRVVIENGVFSKRMEQVDLYRITDYVVERPFGQRLMKTGNLVVQSMDKTTTELRLVGLRTDVRALYERLRTATEAAKRARGVRVVDYE